MYKLLPNDDFESLQRVIKKIVIISFCGIYFTYQAAIEGLMIEDSKRMKESQPMTDERVVRRLVYNFVIIIAFHF